ncbi:hypothetical protein ES707_13282 [subsurface metagenome]
MNARFDWLKVWISLNILFFFFLQVVSSAQIQNVPVAPNDSIITAKVLEYSILNSTLEGIEPEQILYSLRILVISSQSVNGKINFTQSKVDQVIKVYSKEMLSAILFGKVIEANVFFLEDKRGGKYWIRNVRVIGEMSKENIVYLNTQFDEEQIKKTLRYVAESYRTENMELLEQSVSQNSSFYSNIVQTARTTFAHYRDIELTFKDIKIDFHPWDKNNATVTLREIFTALSRGKERQEVKESMDIIKLKKENGKWKITFWYKDVWMKNLPPQLEEKGEAQ